MKWNVFLLIRKDLEDKPMINNKKIIALCTYGIYDPQIFSFIIELNELLKNKDCFLFVYTLNTEIGNGGDFYNAESYVFDLVPFDRVDAVIIMDERIKSRTVVQHIVDRANEYNVPSIIIDGEYDGTSIVKFDYARGFEKVVRHIIEYHHVTKPHFMAGKASSPFSNERIEVFKKVLSENGIAYDDSMLSYGDFWSIPCRNATKKLLERDELPQAIICANDIMAINVCDVLHSAGINTPDDILVSGFDGIDEAFLSTPGITTAICDSKSLAASVMETVMANLQGERNVIKWVIPTFVSNQSCGCPRSDIDSFSKVHEFNNRFYHHQDDIHIMQNLTAVLMCCETFEECAHHIRNTIVEPMCCIVEDGIFNVKRNYFLEDVEPTTKSIIYNYFKSESGLAPYNEETILPYLNSLISAGYPLIFNALEYMGKSIGFVCYSYENYNLLNYTRMPSITNALSMGLGVFITLRYQDYLRKKIQKMYQLDALTGLYNRLAFLSKFEEVKDNPQLSGHPLTIIMADLNGLKKINDSYGHASGDKAIAAVASAIKAACPLGSLCVRFGGDEMLALILGDYDVNAFISQMQHRLEEDSQKLGFTVSASYGSHKALLSKDFDLDKVISIADENMYKMKKSHF